jgi:transaldolase / glucose-6-phosphate isomerase
MSVAAVRERLTALTAAGTSVWPDRLRRSILRVADEPPASAASAYGPDRVRFLHSTGQFHKGGPDTGAFLQLVHDGAGDLEIPGESLSFRRLPGAQADGELETLGAHGLPAARVRLDEGDLAAAIDDITGDLR